MTLDTAPDSCTPLATGDRFDLSVIVTGWDDAEAVLRTLSSLASQLNEYPDMATEVVLVASSAATAAVMSMASGDILTVDRADMSDDAATATGRCVARGAQLHALRAGELLLDGPARALAAKCGAVPNSLRRSGGATTPMPDRLHALGVRLHGELDGDPDRLVVEGPTDLYAGVRVRDGLHVGGFTYSWSTLTTAVRSVGRYSSIAAAVTFAESEHPTSDLSTSTFALDDGKHVAEHLSRMGRSYIRRQISMAEYHAPITIGNDVWVGSRAYIKGGVTLGDGCIIGTNAVVTKDVPPYAVVVGNPGRIVRQRFDDETVSALLALQWWKYDCIDFDQIDVSDVSSSVLAISRRAESGCIRPYQGFGASVGSLIRRLES